MKRIFAALALVLALPVQAQMTTTAQVKPILEMTKGNWVAVREYGGQDLLYFTHLEVFRCGLAQIAFAVNGQSPWLWQTPPCPGDETFSEISADRLPYAAFPLGSIETVWIELTYEDGTVQSEAFARGAIMTP